MAAGAGDSESGGGGSSVAALEAWLKRQGVAAAAVESNASWEELYASMLSGKEGVRTSLRGTVSVDTNFCGRSPLDRYWVRGDGPSRSIDWGEVNLGTTAAAFAEVEATAKAFLSGRRVWVFDGFSGVGPGRLHVRFVVALAWQALFVHNMFVRPDAAELEVLRTKEPQFVVWNAGGVEDAAFESHGHRSGVCVALNVESERGVILGTQYGGEMKKGIFSLQNLLLPLRGVLSMHCAANKDPSTGEVALFCGLSGTGKTSLSADPDRVLIGDDEHAWDDDGVWNLEGGCYAKTVRLSAASEPLIFDAIRPPALLENVGVREDGSVDFDDVSRTENTRVSYPLHHLSIADPTAKGGHATRIIFLTYDAIGALPPVAVLDHTQAAFHFVSGYTAKVSGTERGVTEPQLVFSPCFGAAFMPLHPSRYASLLVDKMKRHGARAYLVNTGLNGTGKRLAFKDTRHCISAILSGAIDDAPTATHPIFRFKVPTELPHVEPALLDPQASWEDPEAYKRAATKLAKAFIQHHKDLHKDGGGFWEGAPVVEEEAGDAAEGGGAAED